MSILMKVAAYCTLLLITATALKVYTNELLYQLDRLIDRIEL